MYIINFTKKQFQMFFINFITNQLENAQNRAVQKKPL